MINQILAERPTLRELPLIAAPRDDNKIARILRAYEGSIKHKLVRRVWRHVDCNAFEYAVGNRGLFVYITDEPEVIQQAHTVIVSSHEFPSAHHSCGYMFLKIDEVPDDPKKENRSYRVARAEFTDWLIREFAPELINHSDPRSPFY